MKKIFLFLTTVALVVFVSCKHENATPLPAPRSDIHLDSSNASLGARIVDKDDKALYFFSDDADGQSSCTGGCLGTWPVYLADTSATFGNGLLASDFATITNASGAKQTTYKGWPLYYFAPGGVPEAAGNTNGEGIGNVWFVAKTNYTIMIANYQLTGLNGINYLNTYAPGDGRTNYFTDGKGNTLYAFAKDSAYINKFTKPDFSNNPSWPVYETANITVPSTIDKSLFVVTPFNGKNQLTYKGWPMYYFGPDNSVRGATKGITIPASLPAGTIWPVIVKDAPLAPR